MPFRLTDRSIKKSYRWRNKRGSTWSRVPPKNDSNSNSESEKELNKLVLTRVPREFLCLVPLPSHNLFFFLDMSLKITNAIWNFNLRNGSPKYFHNITHKIPRPGQCRSGVPCQVENKITSKHYSTLENYIKSLSTTLLI